MTDSILSGNVVGASSDSDVVQEQDTKVSGLITSSTNFYTASVERLATASPADVQQIAAAQIELLSQYHIEVLDQAKKSFSWALVAAGIGLLFFLAAVGFALLRQTIDVAVISTVCGIIIEFISAINFYLYSRASLQMAEYQERLDRTQRFLLANSMCEGLEGETKQQSRSKLIEVIANTTYSSEILKADVNRNDKE